jgi:hypothetical protein
MQSFLKIIEYCVNLCCTPVMTPATKAGKELSMISQKIIWLLQLEVDCIYLNFLKYVD